MPGLELGWMVLAQVEPDAAIVKVDAGARLCQPGAEAGSVGLDQRHTHSGAVDRAEIRRITIATRRPTVRGTFCIDHVESSGDGLQQLSPLAVSLRTSGRSNPAAVAASISRWAKRHVVGVRWQVEPTGQFGCTEREVALGIGWQGPQVDSEGVRHQRRHPFGQRSAEVVVAVEAGTEVSSILRRTLLGRTRRDRPRRWPSASELRHCDEPGRRDG